MAVVRGPYRVVHDNELRSIFYLTPQTGKAFMVTVQTGSFHGSSRPGVTPLLRDMLYLLKMNLTQRIALRQKIRTTLTNREEINICAKLLSISQAVTEEPWKYAALMDTATCKKLYREIKQISDGSDKIASTLSDPASDLGIGAGIAKWLKPVAGVTVFGLSLTRYFSAKSKDYYVFYAQRIADELALRGIPASSLG